MASVAALNELRHLWLNETRVTDRGMALLSALKKLESLSLYDTKVTHEAVAALERAIPGPGGLAVNGAIMTDEAQKPESAAADDAAHTVRRLPDVPVFNCHVYTSPADANGMLHARVSNLPEVIAEGRTQREVLQKIVAAFKTTIQRYLEGGGTIPWTSPPLPRRQQENEVWIAVHL